MRVIVVHVRRVIVRVNNPIMCVAMRVLAEHRRIVRVFVMPVVVSVRVLVVGWIVCVLVAMLLRDMQVDANAKAPRRDKGQQ